MSTRDKRQPDLVQSCKKSLTPPGPWPLPRSSPPRTRIKFSPPHKATVWKTSLGLTFRPLDLFLVDVGRGANKKHVFVSSKVGGFQPLHHNKQQCKMFPNNNHAFLWKPTKTNKLTDLDSWYKIKRVGTASTPSIVGLVCSYGESALVFGSQPKSLALVSWSSLARNNKSTMLTKCLKSV